MDFFEAGLGDTDSVDNHLAAAWLFRTVEDAKKGAFPRTAGTGDEDEFSWRNLQIDIRKSFDLAGIGLRDMKYLYH